MSELKHGAGGTRKRLTSHPSSATTTIMMPAKMTGMPMTQQQMASPAESAEPATMPPSLLCAPLPAPPAISCMQWGVCFLGVGGERQNNSFIRQQ